MLATLPNLANRSFILGFFLPTLLFAIAALLLFQDVPELKALLDDLIAKDITKAAYILLMVWVMAVALLMLNHPLYRFLEGYSFPDWLAELLKARKRKRLEDALGELNVLFARAAAEGNGFPASDRRRFRLLRRDTALSMPSTPADVLPTDFGNAIRAFELYSRDIYGADGVWVWLRLGSVLPKDFAEQMQDSRTQIDFLINCWLHTVTIVTLASGRVIYALVMRQAAAPIWIWVAVAAAGVLAAWLFYRWAISRVPAWGDWVMTAYDCYLPALAKQLGYELPSTEEKRIEFWRTFSQQLIYRRDPEGELAFKVEQWIKPPPAPAEPTAGTQAIVVAVDVNDSRR